MPLEVIPAVLVQHCCAIAFYYLCDQRASDQARDRYREALAWLKDVMNGNVPVGVDTNGAAPESGDLPQVQSDAAVFRAATRRASYDYGNRTGIHRPIREYFGNELVSVDTHLRRLERQRTAHHAD